MRKQNGITLIALVISIIVMLILAGVSINAVIGDNGVIGKSQETLYLQSCAVLEEFLQMKYAENYEETGEFRTAKDFLYTKYPNWFYKNSLGYISDAYGHALYLLNMEEIYQTNPELRNQIKGGTASTVGEFYGQKDVYGITSDLNVFYCSDGVDTILGASLEDLDLDNPLEDAYSKDSILSQIVNGEGTEEGLSYQDLKAITELTIDTNEKVAVLNEFSQLLNLKTVTLKDLTNVNLTGIDGAKKLEILNIQNCLITDYSAISNCSSLVSLYLINQNNEQAQLFMENLKLAELSKLEYLGMYGTTTNKITDISKLAEWNSVTKEAIKYLYFYTENINSVSALSTFTNLEYLSIYGNTALTSLEGIKNLTTLKTIYAYSCGLTNLPNFATNSSLQYLSIYSNKGITTLSGLENCKNLQSLYAYNCAITDITALSGNIALKYLSLYTNANLVNVAAIASCTSVNNLYLANNTQMSVNDVKTLSPIIANCKKNYNIPSKYLQYLTTLTSYDYTNFNLTDSSDQITHLKNGTQIYRLSLSGNTNLGKSRLVSLIKGGQMSIEELAVVKENLTLTDEEMNYITTLQGYTLTDIQALDDTTIASMENESDIYLRYVLSTLTGLQYLSLENLSNLTQVDFMNKVVYINGLDLYGTNVEDLSVMENKALNMVDLRINNSNIDLTKIQSTISRLVGGSFFTASSSLGSTYEGFKQIGGGLIPESEELLSQLGDCNKITHLHLQTHSKTNYSTSEGYILDLTGCTNLTTMEMHRVVSGTVILPSNLVYAKIHDNGFFEIDFSNANSLETLLIGGHSGTAEGMDNLAKNLADFDKIKEITIKFYWGDYRYEDIFTYTDWLKKFENCNSLESLTVGTHWDRSPYNDLMIYGDLSEIILPNSLKNLDLHYLNITKMPDVSKCNQLEKLNVSMNSIENLDFAQNLLSLKELIANDNKINSIAGIRNCKQLENINLENNFIYDNSYTTENENTRAYNNCSILAELYQSKLRKLFLKGNYIDDFSPIENLGWEEENKSGF